MHIRPRLLGDVDRCVEIAESVQKVDGYPGVAVADVRRFITPSCELAAWVAEAEGDIIGHVALHRTPNEATTEKAVEVTQLPADDFVALARLFVHPDARRLGAARALVDRATAEAVRLGKRPILDVSVTFGPAIALYESAGWARAGEVTLKLNDVKDFHSFVYIGPS